MTNKEAIEAIKSNYPPANYSILREALDKAIEALEQTEWILCSERLPNDMQAVNITWCNRNPAPYYADIKDVPFVSTGCFYCYEIKSSVEDFKSKNGHNFIGDFNYYVMPEDVYQIIKNQTPYNVGVYVPDESGKALYSIKKAKRKDRDRPVSEMILMMFRSAKRNCCI